MARPHPFHALRFLGAALAVVCLSPAIRAVGLHESSAALFAGVAALADAATSPGLESQGASVGAPVLAVDGLRGATASPLPHLPRAALYLERIETRDLLLTLDLPDPHASLEGVLFLRMDAGRVLLPGVEDLVGDARDDTSPPLAGGVPAVAGTAPR